MSRQIANLNLLRTNKVDLLISEVSENHRGALLLYVRFRAHRLIELPFEKCQRKPKKKGATSIAASLSIKPVFFESSLQKAFQRLLLVSKSEEFQTFSSKVLEFRLNWRISFGA